MSKLIVSLSPHIHGNDSIERNMYGVIIALLPALLVSFYYFGIGAAIVCLTSVVACVFFEWVINRYLLHNRNLSVLDGSAVITGLLLAFNLPSNMPVWIVIIGALVAIGIGKMTFGGLGCNPFNPALVGRCFLFGFIPGTDDIMAGCRTAITLHGCSDRCDSIKPYERSCKNGRCFNPGENA